MAVKSRPVVFICLLPPPPQMLHKSSGNFMCQIWARIAGIFMGPWLPRNLNGGHWNKGLTGRGHFDPTYAGVGDRNRQMDPIPQMATQRTVHPSIADGRRRKNRSVSFQKENLDWLCFECMSSICWAMLGSGRQTMLCLDLVDRLCYAWI